MCVCVYCIINIYCIKNIDTYSSTHKNLKINFGTHFLHRRLLSVIDILYDTNFSFIIYLRLIRGELNISGYSNQI